jgi:hypothetical protein
MPRSPGANWRFLPAILIGFPGVSCRIPGWGKNRQAACKALYFVLLLGDVVLPKDTPLEIGFGNPHPAAASQPPRPQ